MAVTEVGTPSAVVVQSGNNTGNVTGSWSGTQPRTAGDYLVAEVTAYGTTTAGAISPPAGWAVATDGTNNAQKTSSTGRSSVAQFVKVAAGADANPTFTCTMTGTATQARMTCFLRELTGQGSSPVATVGLGDGTSSPLSMTSAANVPSSGCLAIATTNTGLSAATTDTYTADTTHGWSNDYNTGSTSARSHSASDSQAGPASGSTLPCDPASTGTIDEFTGVMIVVQPPGGVSGAAALSGGAGVLTAGSSLSIAAAAALSGGSGVLTAGATFTIPGAAALAGGAGVLTAGATIPSTLPPPPTVPVFPAGYQPQQADFNTWWYDNLWFFQKKPVFRARQTVAPTTVPSSGAVTPIAYDTIDEDEFSGWNASTHAWTPPAGYSGWYQVTITPYATGLAAGDLLRADITGTYTYGLAAVTASPVHATGVEGQFSVYLIGGQDTVQGAAQLLNASSGVSTSLTAGQQSSIEICWLCE